MFLCILFSKNFLFYLRYNHPVNHLLSSSRFPKKKTYFKQWAKSISVVFPGTKINSASKICSLHFPANAFANNDRRQKLKETAVPEVTSTSVYNGQDEDILIYIGQDNVDGECSCDGQLVVLSKSRLNFCRKKSVGRTQHSPRIAQEGSRDPNKTMFAMQFIENLESCSEFRRNRIILLVSFSFSFRECNATN
jgi:hypothetical protein